MVDRIKTQQTGQREVDDAQRAAQKLSDQLNDGPLALSQLPFTTLATSIVAWVAAGNQLVQPMGAAMEKCILRDATWASTLALAADGTNYRTFTLDLYRGGAKISTLGSRSTAVAGITALVAYPFELSARASDLTLQVDDIIILTLDGGGTKPALNNGVITLYFEKIK